ncbi:MAG: RNA methyltransferase [Pseudomonadota bacterium]
MTVIPVQRPDDPRIAPYISIRERDLTGRDGRFIVEGKVTLRILLTQSRFRPESLFLSKTRLEPLQDLISAIPEGIPIYTAPQTVMDEIAGFPVHRGVLACALKGESLDLDETLNGARTLLVLAGLSNHDNVGAAFRNAAAFGADAVLLDQTSCDPLYRKAIRVSAGAALWLPFIHGGDAMPIVDAIKARGFDVWAMTPRADAVDLYSLKRPDKLAILLGPEGPGLSDALIDAGQPVRIPMATGFDSVNVATAGAIALSHAFRA